MLRSRLILLALLAVCFCGGGATMVRGADDPAPVKAAPGEFRAIDADGHNVLINRPGKITVVIGTNQDSQDQARAAGRAMYPFQGMPTFRLIVIADVRDSMATWVPSLVTSRMRVSLDHEAYELKPYYLKNGNTNDPRKFSCAIADFSGVICPQLGWEKPTSNLRGIIFGTDGHVLKRWEDLSDLKELQDEVRKALHVAPVATP